MGRSSPCVLLIKRLLLCESFDVCMSCMCVCSPQAVVEDVDGRTPIDVARDEARMILLKVESWLRTEASVLEAESRVLKDDDVEAEPGRQRRSSAAGTEHRRASSEDLNQAIAQGDRRLLENIVMKEPQLLQTRNSYGDIPLHVAAFKGDLETCQLIVGQGGAELLRQKNDDGETPLHVAASQNRIEVVEWMIQQGGTDLLKVQANDGQTPLHYAVARNFTGLAKSMITLGDPALLDVPDKQGATPKTLARSVDMRAALADALKEVETMHNKILESSVVGGGPSSAQAEATHDVGRSLLQPLRRKSLS